MSFENGVVVFTFFGHSTLFLIFSDYILQYFLRDFVISLFNSNECIYECLN